MATKIKFPYHRLPNGRYRRYLELRDAIKLASTDIEEDLEEWLAVGSAGSHKIDRGYEWDFNAGYDGALRMFKVGWPEKVQALTNQVKVISALSARPNIEYSHEIAGDEVDVSRYLAGEPECFLEGKLNDKNSENPVISIFYSLNMAGHLDASLRERMGACVFAIVQALESLGRAVEIYVSWPSEGGGGWIGRTEDKLSDYILIKAAHEYLNPSRLAFCLIHPAMLRRIWFRIREQDPAEMQRTFGIRCAGYGACAYLYQEDFPPDSIVFNTLISENDCRPFESDESAAAYIQKILETRGLSFN